MTLRTRLMAALLSASHLNLHLCLKPQCLASVVTSSYGAVKPPSLLQIEQISPVDVVFQVVVKFSEEPGMKDGDAHLPVYV